MKNLQKNPTNVTLGEVGDEHVIMTCPNYANDRKNPFDYLTKVFPHVRLLPSVL